LDERQFGYITKWTPKKNTDGRSVAWVHIKQAYEKSKVELVRKNYYLHSAPILATVHITMPHTHIEKVSAMQIFYIYDLYQRFEMETCFVEDNVNAKVKSKSRDSPIKKKLQAPTSNPNQLSSNEAYASLNFEPAWSTFSMYSCLVANHGDFSMY
jgi:hypothetical protein